MTAGWHQVLQEAGNIPGGFEELLVFLVFLKIEICDIFIAALTGLFQKPGLAHLTHALQDQGFAIRGVLPVRQLLQNKSFHSSTLHTFIIKAINSTHTFVYRALQIAC